MKKVLKYNEAVELINEKSYFKAKEVANILGLSVTAVKNLCEGGYLKTKVGERNVLLIDNDSINYYIEGNKDYLFNEEYITVKEFIQQYMVENVPKTSLDPSVIKQDLNFISLSGLRKPYKFKCEELNNYLANKQISTKILYNTEVLDQDKNYLNRQQTCEYIECSDKFLRNKLNKEDINYAYKSGASYYFHIEDVKHLKKQYEIEKFTRENSGDSELVYNLIQDIKNQEYYPITITLFNKYITRKLSNSQRRDKKTYIKSNVNMVDYLINKIGKEVTEINQTELVDLFSGDSPQYIKKLYSSFLKFIKVHNEVQFDNIPLIKTKQNPNKSTIYSKKEFSMYIKHLKDHELHLYKAVNRYTYAQKWFYLIMHFTNGWRSSDIGHFPSLGELGLEGYSLEWFLHNKISITESQKILNNTKDIKQFTINKTGEQNMLFVPYEMITVFVTAMLICELHRRRENLNYLLNSFSKSPYRDKDLRDFLLELPYFSSRKANKTLLTFTNNKAISMGKFSNVSNLISKRLRGHKDEQSIASYIVDEAEEEDVARHLFNRGEFGYLYSMVIDIVSGEEEITLEDKTEAIQILKDYFRPTEIENNANFALLNQDKYIGLAREIIQMSNEELLNKLERIANREMPSKEISSQCFSDNCIKPKGSCLTCKYLLPNTYILESAKKEVKDIISELNRVDYGNNTYRIKLTYLLTTVLSLINEASQTFGSEFVSAYIDLKELNREVAAVKHYLLDAKEV